MRSVNMRLQLTQDNGVYKAEVIWARCGRCGVVLKDTAGYWKEMPAEIEEVVYDGLSEVDRDRMRTEPPEIFPRPIEAVRWGMDQVDASGQSVFKD
jgi:hypothetical protein